MVYTIATKGCKLSDKILDHIEKHIKKLVSFLPQFDPDLPFFELIIKKHKRKRLNYDGTIMLRLPKKPLATHIIGANIDEAINIGFKRIVKELKTYKGEHFQSDSGYFDHTSIRH